MANKVYCSYFNKTLPAGFPDNRYSLQFFIENANRQMNIKSISMTVEHYNVTLGYKVPEQQTNKQHSSIEVLTENISNPFSIVSGSFNTYGGGLWLYGNTSLKFDSFFAANRIDFWLRLLNSDPANEFIHSGSVIVEIQEKIIYV